MFVIEEQSGPSGHIQYRYERLTGFSCRISPSRTEREIEGADAAKTSLPPAGGREGCPFCPENVFTSTPVFPGGGRVRRGESVTFPNLFPFSECHVVTVVTEDHAPPFFTEAQIRDALCAQSEVLCRGVGYASINWNQLPSAGASIYHPHMQGLSDRAPSFRPRQYMEKGMDYLSRNNRSWWEDLCLSEANSERLLFGDEIMWSAHAVPAGEREIWGVLPVSSLEDAHPYFDLLAEGICRVIALYRAMGSYAFNMSVFFGKNGEKDPSFSAFCSMIARINPNPLSMGDSAFMERLHLEPVILTLPEEIRTWL